MNIGDEVTFRALHADGECYRWWYSTVEAVHADRIVVWMFKDEIIHQPNGDRSMPCDSRLHVLLDKWYSVEELLKPDGTCVELYLNINAPVIIEGNQITYTDYELDVSKVMGQPAEIIDQDEFAEAILRYGYSPEHQARCWAAAHEALLLAESWTPQPQAKIKSPLRRQRHASSNTGFASARSRSAVAWLPSFSSTKRSCATPTG